MAVVGEADQDGAALGAVMIRFRRPTDSEPAIGPASGPSPAGAAAVMLMPGSRQVPGVRTSAHAYEEA